MPQQKDRVSSVDLKLAVLPQVIRGKRVVVVDDSIVRGNTARRRVQLLREAGATEVHMRISCPPIKHPCFYGIDFPTTEELIAGDMSVDAVRKFTGADTLGYLSLDALYKPFGKDKAFCCACFDGNYPTDLSDITASKEALEASPELALNLQ
jgi:amidophosphoribosyltransferase